MGLSERTNLQFRAEFFNIANHPNFGTPNAVVYSAANAAVAPTAGRLLRQIRFNEAAIG